MFFISYDARERCLCSLIAGVPERERANEGPRGRLLFPFPVRCHSSFAVEHKNISDSLFALEKNARSDGPPVLSFNS